MPGTSCSFRGTSVMTERELLARYSQDGAPEVLEEIIGRYTDLVYSVCVRVLDNKKNPRTTPLKPRLSFS